MLGIKRVDQVAMRLFLKIGGGVKGSGRCQHEYRDKHTSMTLFWTDFQYCDKITWGGVDNTKEGRLISGHPRNSF